MFERKKLSYSFDALEPHIDAMTMELHSEKHHQAYTDKLNEALKGSEWEDKSIEEILMNLDKLPEDIRTKVKNNGGGYYNHNVFFATLSENGGGEPSGKLADGITKYFGSFEKFKEEMVNTATGVFGSGWAWLAADENGEKWHIHGHPNQENPLMHGHKPIFGIDVWEHAYYLKYQNKRPDYLEAIWNVVDWDKVGEMI